MSTTPRKNLSGLASHLRRLVNEVQLREFPELGHVEVSLWSMVRDKSVHQAHWDEFERHDGSIYRRIHFNATGQGAAREYYLTADDEELVLIIRHELTHGLMHLRGLPSNDEDPAFIMECLRRGVFVNDASIPAFEAVYGRGTFDTFRAFLPAPKTEEIVLANSAGIMIREVFNSTLRR